MRARYLAPTEATPAVEEDVDPKEKDKFKEIRGLEVSVHRSRLSLSL
jgi:hypothetical protein